MRSSFQTSMRSIRSQSVGGAGSGTARAPAGPGRVLAGAGPVGWAQAHAASAVASAIVVALLALEARAELPAAEVLEQPAAEVLERLGPPVGESRSELVVEGDTLLDVAYRNRVGFHALTGLNPDVDVWLPAAGTVVELPTRTLLPDADRRGLVINIPEMKLFDFTAPGGLRVLAAAVGDPEVPTPVGSFTVQGKRERPSWNVPRSIRAERPELPDRVEPGPKNPLGSRWMRIGKTAYGIHGTNVRWSIGRLATHGCVRLYEQDIRELFDRTPEGTPLTLVYQPFKWGRDGTTLLFEAHPDLYDRTPARLASALVVPRELGLLPFVDVEAVWRAVEASRGEPVPVGELPAGMLGASTSKRSS